MINDYELYKGNQLVTFGTIRDIAEELGIEERTVRHYSTPSYIKRTKGDNGYRLYKKSKTPVYEFYRYGIKYTGTKKQIQEQTGLSDKTLYNYICTGKFKYIGEC